MNTLSGILPSSFFNLSSLTIINLPQNFIGGNLPADFAQRFPKLVSLYLSINKFTGPVPVSFSNASNLQELALGDNLFTGTVPSFDRQTGLTWFAIGDNKLGNGNSDNLNFVSSLANCTYLTFLSFGDNLGGVLPKSLFNFTRLTQLWVTGSLISGNIPSEIFPVVSMIFFLIIAVTSYLVYKRKYGKKASPESDSNIESFPQVSYRNLQKATNGFSSENLIGSGKFSSVYKAVLTQKDGPQVVAVKVLKLAVHGAHKTFIAEGEALRNIRHRNLVKVITSCSGVDYQGNDFKALIYSCMVYGSLEDWLHQNPVVGLETEEATRCLNFIQRLNIAIDVARALDYIHCQCGSPMVRCDIKPSNILLDVDLVAHLGDFGLARFLQCTSHDFSASHNSSLGIIGTIGYAAPEYGMGGQTSTYGDIYSFGILILEMFTGKRPTHEMFRNGPSLRDFVKMSVPDQVMEITDSILLETGDVENARYRAHRSLKESLAAVYQIGITCSLESPRDRIDMNIAFDQLQSVKKTFLGGRRNLP